MFKSSNVGTIDRAVRMAVGLILIALPYMTDLALWTNPAARWISIVVGAVLVATALGRFCPLYRLLGMDTCRAH